MSIKKFENVLHIFINGKKYSTCDMYLLYYSIGVGNAWLFGGKPVCEGWYKKGGTIFKKWVADKTS